MSNRSRNFNEPEIVYRGTDDSGYRLYAGGLIPYDDSGIWVITENVKNKSVYSDAGGKYTPEDIDIFGCIAREWNEELYYTYEITRSMLLELLTFPRTIKKYLCDSNRSIQKRYLCMFVHTEDLERLTGKMLSDVDIYANRKHAITSNVIAHKKGYYTTNEFLYIELPKNSEKIQRESRNRLRVIMKDPKIRKLFK